MGNRRGSIYISLGILSLLTLFFLRMKNEVSLQLQRFFCHRVNLYEEIKMKSVVVSCWDKEVRDGFVQGIRALERSWRFGVPFNF